MNQSDKEFENLNVPRGLLWNFRESFIISIGILLLGFVIELLLHGKSILIPSWPYNFLIIVIFITVLILCHRYVKHPIIRWFSSIPAAIASISTFTLLVLLMGFIKQDVPSSSALINNLGLTHIARCWAYLLQTLFFLTILGFTIIKRIPFITLKNLAVVLSHVGLWILIVAASLGTSDLQEYQMPVEEHQTSNIAYDDNNNPHTMPFSIELLDFRIDEYPPQLVLLDKNNQVIRDKNGAHEFPIKEGANYKIQDWQITVTKYIESSRPEGEGYSPTSEKGGTPSAFIEVRNPVTSEKYNGWISSGSIIFSNKGFHTNDGYLFFMSQPQPHRYVSDVKAHLADNSVKTAHIAVNNSLVIDGWDIYQASYDSEMGKWSNYSVFNVVRDPWLKVVYLGIIMLIAGAVLFLWYGKTS